MSPRKSITARYLTLPDYSKPARTIVYSVTALVVVFGIDLIGHLLGWSWYWERLVCNVLEAVILGLIATHLIHLQEERLLRREREIGYLNHHVRNSLALIEIAVHQLVDEEKRYHLVHQGSSRICTVLEQLSRNEDINIDAQIPEKYKDAA
jgi:hypothetical protein